MTLGEIIDGLNGPDAQWDRVTTNGTTGYVTDEEVDTQGDINDPNLIPAC